MDYKYKLDYPAIAKRIKAARNAAGLTQETLAEMVGISTNAMGKLEVNLMTTSLKTLINIANVLDLDMNYLLCGDEEKALDPLIDRMLQNLSGRDKEFTVHTILGLKKYYPENKAE